MIRLIRTSSDHGDFTNLVRRLDAELWERYEELQAQYARHNKVEKNNTVVLAYADNLPSGCGCFKKYNDDTVEVKRMFVAHDHRGKGIAGLILKELECWAKELGYSKVILETGLKQPEAIGLYKKAGFVVTENYEPYVNMKESVCMQKFLNGKDIA
ncbi:MAG: GNAT family N-acetyltransferase [Bacteroidota bacterium]